jgi:PKD repeat protein
MNKHEARFGSVSRKRRAVVALLAAAAVAAAGAVSIKVDQHAADADTAPANGTPATVSADGLPTVQINGVVWAQTTVGNTVYVTGDFTQARPAGVAVNGAGSVARADLLAYDITTGQLITTFNHSLNGPGRAITASPDGTQLYVGGDFTTVDGVTHNHVAAFNIAAGTLVTSFTPSFNNTVLALAATNDTVYVGGQFTTANGVARLRAAAYSRAGVLSAAWNPAPDSNVHSMTFTPDKSRLVLGGQFVKLAGATAVGMGSVDATTGASEPWAANQTIQDSGGNADISTLTSDGTNVYGAGYFYTTGGNFEGRFAANPTTGAIVWMDNCHGDSYSVFQTGGVLYSAGHAHDCSDIGAFSQDKQAVFPATHHFILAEATANTAGTVNRHPLFPGGAPGPTYHDFAGEPATTLLDWFPTLSYGSFTGQDQADWSLTGNSQYISAGGEFPTVNGVAQQGLVRFAVSSTAPNKVGPTSATTLTPSVYSQKPGTARVAWQATYDNDNVSLVYKLYRDNGSSPIYTTTTSSTFWNRPNLGFTDSGLVTGSSHSYKVTVTDPFGNSVTSGSTTVTVTSASPNAYATRILGDGATNYWPLSDAPGSSRAADGAGYADLTVAGVTFGAGGPVNGTSAASLPGGEVTSGTGLNQTTTPNDTAGTIGMIEPSSAAFSTEAWFKTSSTAGGEILGLGLYNASDSAAVDKVIYLDSSGHLHFGVQNNATRQTIDSTGTYNDNTWHLATATYSGTTARLYVDGEQVASGTDMPDNITFPGFWRVGGDQLLGWTSAPSSYYLKASIGQAAVYPSALSAATVAAHYTAGTGATPVNVAPSAAFTQSCNALACSFNGSTSTDSDGTIASYAWNFGDGSTATGVAPSHTYSTAGTKSVSLTVTDNSGATNTVSKSVTVTSGANAAPTAAFTAACTALVCSVDGSTSSDPDGTIATYSWAWGDGTTSAATGPTSSHTFAAAGSYSITLTVTDNGGATGTATQAVSPTASASTVLAQDAFDRSVTGGFGTASPTGGLWTPAGTTSTLSVSPGAAKMALPAGSLAGAYLGGISTNSVDITTSFTLDKVPAAGNGYYFWVVARRISKSEEYLVRVRVLPAGSVRLTLTKYDGAAGTEVALGSETVATTLAAGATINIHVQATGVSPTTLRARAWTQGSAEPSTWTVTATDASAALQVAGSIGLQGDLSGSSTNGPITASVSSFVASKI